MKALLRRRCTMRRTVQDVMTREVVAVRGSTPFKELVRLLNGHRVTDVPVVDRSDLLRLPPGTVEVEVGDGVVGLTGRVPRHSQALAMEKLTAAVDGVVAVESELQWQAEDTGTQVPPAEPPPS